MRLSRMDRNATSWFSRFARDVATAAAQPATFGTAILMTAVWLGTGWVFRYSDTWQLVMNTITSIITFLMVFVIQNTQLRDSIAVQIKLDELIRANAGARNALLDLESLDEPQLRKILEHYEHMAHGAREELKRTVARREHRLREAGRR